MVFSARPRQDRNEGKSSVAVSQVLRAEMGGTKFEV